MSLQVQPEGPSGSISQALGPPFSEPQWQAFLTGERSFQILPEHLTWEKGISESPQLLPSLSATSHQECWISVFAQGWVGAGDGEGVGGTSTPVTAPTVHQYKAPGASPWRVQCDPVLHGQQTSRPAPGGAQLASDLPQPQTDTSNGSGNSTQPLFWNKWNN